MLLRSNPKLILKCIISVGVQEKRKDRKCRSLPILRKEMGSSHPGWNQRDRPTDAEGVRSEEGSGEKKCRFKEKEDNGKIERNCGWSHAVWRERERERIHNTEYSIVSN